MSNISKKLADWEKEIEDRFGNVLFTGTEFDLAVDKQCKSHLVGRSTILEDDEPVVVKAKNLVESECRGGIN